MRIHLLSDLHNSAKQRFVPVVRDADVTILAGDIDEQLDGIAWAEKHFQGDIIYVPGNHEFYGGRISRTLEKLKAAAGPRTHVLDRESVVLHGVRFLGAVGWTDYRSSGNEHLAMLAAQNTLGDFKEIRHKERGAYVKTIPEVFRQEALKTKAWLAEELCKPFNGKIVVVTHHAPSTRSSPGELVGKHINAAYTNHWEDLFGEGLDLWVHGHTHTAVDYEFFGTRVISNPHGHRKTRVGGFQADLVIDL